VTSGSWPYLPGQCPHCFYFQAERPTFTEDLGYEIVGVCLHPRVGMGPFRSQKLERSKVDPCRLFIRRVGVRPDAVQPSSSDLR
jgi:hypothetical protein